MLRSLLALVFFGAAALVTLPFLMSSLYVDQRGIEISGRVYSKREDAIVQYSTWYRSCEVTVEYQGPDEPGVSFLKVELPPDRYDGFRQGQQVKLHYLRRQDVPEVPLAKPLREIGLLPRARLAGERAFSGLMIAANQSGLPVLVSLGAAVLLLVLWRLSRLPGFPWAVAACVLGVVALLLASEFPRPGAAPAAEVRRGAGQVKSVGRIYRLFSGSRTRGEIASQPVSVVGVEFLPEGRLEPVLAVDLIDEGSLPLHPGAAVSLEYELRAPRTAYLLGATRAFPRRNLNGLALVGGFYVALLLGVVFGAHYLGRAWKRLLKSRRPPIPPAPARR
jgi:hypothetical protein